MHCLSKPSDIGAAWNQHLPQACSRTVLSHHGTCKGTFFSSPLLMRLWGCYHDDLLGYSLGWTCPNTYCQGRSPKPPFMLLKRRFTNRRISDDPVAGSKIFQNKRILQHMHWLWCLTCRMFSLCYACSERSFRRTKNISSIQLANNILLTSNCPMWNTVILLVQAWTRPAPPPPPLLLSFFTRAQCAEDSYFSQQCCVFFYLIPSHFFTSRTILQWRLKWILSLCREIYRTIQSSKHIGNLFNIPRGALFVYGLATSHAGSLQ